MRRLIMEILLFTMAISFQARCCSSLLFHYNLPTLRRLPTWITTRQSSSKVGQFRYSNYNNNRIRRQTQVLYDNNILEEYDVNNEQTWFNQIGSDPISNLLVCGDGDLSFSADIANVLNKLNINLIATVLEEQNIHQSVYQRSLNNQETIVSYSGHKVNFGVDATKLEETFPNEKFDRIQFNFPHWRGKANHRYNRQLIDAFLKSASVLLAPGGEIHIALCEGQGGSNSKDLMSYRDTWMPSFYASQYGLMLIDVLPFSPSYNLSSHRGVDRGFKIGKTPEMYVFAKPNINVTVRRKEQSLCCRHELHVILPDDLDVLHTQGLSELSSMDIIEGDAIKKIIETVVPDGLRVEVPERKVLMKETTGYDFNMILFLVVYCGDSKVLQRDEADMYRHCVECEVGKYLPLRENRLGRLVSRPFPYYLLRSIIDDHTS